MLAVAMLGLALLDPMRATLERTMTTHMLAQYPLLLVAGALAARALPWRTVRRLRPYLPAGAPALVASVLLMSAAMVPRVVDAAVASATADAAKAAMLVGAGALAALGWRPAGRIGQAFVVGNVCWMLAAGGLVLAESPDRVCASYLEGDQRRAGLGLVAWSLAAGAAWLADVRRRRQVTRMESVPVRTVLMLAAVAVLGLPAAAHAQTAASAADAAEEKLDYELREIATAQEKYYVENNNYARNTRALLRYYKVPAGMTLVIVNATKTGFSAVMIAAEAPDVVCGIAVGTAANPFGGYFKEGKPLCRER